MISDFRLHQLKSWQWKNLENLFTKQISNLTLATVYIFRVSNNSQLKEWIKIKSVFCVSKNRSSRSQMFFKTGVLFNKVAGLQDCKFIKKRYQHRCFPVNIAKFLRTAFLQNTSGGYCETKHISG